MTTIKAFAPAKINLTLHVTGQRADGYHLLDSLVVFADFGDTLSVAPSGSLSLDVDGPLSLGVPTDAKNLVIQAARLLSPDKSAAIRLTKRLPAAAGIGGGSSDAAAAIRALSQLWSLPVPKNTVSLGADVPVCLDPRPVRMQGVGDHVTAVDRFPSLPAVLVNPGVSVETPPVFKKLVQKTNAPMPNVIPLLHSVEDAAKWLAEQRNDLQAPACQLAPEINDVLMQMSDSLLARMSGSGATCFGLYATQDLAAVAADRILQAHPKWWVKACTLGRANPA